MKERIKEVRKALGLSQTVFGESLGVSLSAVRKWESGENVVSDAVVMLIAQKYGVNETWLRTGVGDMKAAPDREAEMSALVKALMADRPDSFRSALITALLRFRPDGPEWSALERIYESVANSKKDPEE